MSAGAAALSAAGDSDVAGFVFATVAVAANDDNAVVVADVVPVDGVGVTAPHSFSTSASVTVSGVGAAAASAASASAFAPYASASDSASVFFCFN